MQTAFDDGMLEVSALKLNLVLDIIRILTKDQRELKIAIVRVPIYIPRP